MGVPIGYSHVAVPPAVMFPGVGPKVRVHLNVLRPSTPLSANVMTPSRVIVDPASGRNVSYVPLNVTCSRPFKVTSLERQAMNTVSNSALNGPFPSKVMEVAWPGESDIVPPPAQGAVIVTFPSTVVTTD